VGKNITQCWLTTKLCQFDRTKLRLIPATQSKQALRECTCNMQKLKISYQLRLKRSTVQFSAKAPAANCMSMPWVTAFLLAFKQQWSVKIKHVKKKQFRLLCLVRQWATGHYTVFITRCHIQETNKNQLTNCELRSILLVTCLFVDIPINEIQCG